MVAAELFFASFSSCATSCERETAAPICATRGERPTYGTSVSIVEQPVSSSGHCRHATADRYRFLPAVAFFSSPENSLKFAKTRRREKREWVANERTSSAQLPPRAICARARARVCVSDLYRATALSRELSSSPPIRIAGCFTAERIFLAPPFPPPYNKTQPARISRLRATPSPHPLPAQASGRHLEVEKQYRGSISPLVRQAIDYSVANIEGRTINRSFFFPLCFQSPTES